MRVSERQRYWVTHERVDRARQDHVDTLNTLSTQKRINKVYDDPLSHVQALKIKNTLHRFDEFQNNMNFSKGFLEATETAIASIHERLSRAQELALSMANDSYDKINRQISAKEVREIFQQVIKIANTRYNNKFVFAGFRNAHPAVDSKGTFLGDDGEIFLNIGEQQFKGINIPGRSLFHSDAEARSEGHFNLLDSIELLATGLEHDGKDAIYRAIDELSYQMDKVASFQAHVGSLWQTISESEKRLEFSRLQAQKNLSQREDADIFQASSNFKRAEAVLQSTLLASNKLLQPSLLNFMQ